MKLTDVRPVSELGDRATAVDVGRYSGALTWADPDASGLRTHNLYWFDGTYLMSLVAVRGPEDLVNMGRELACS